MTSEYIPLHDAQQVDLDKETEAEAQPILHVEQHKGVAGQYIKSIIYGGLDGVVSVFVTVASLEGAATNVAYILILGLAKLIAGAVSMGVGDWLSTQAEVQYARGEREREEWEVDNYLDGEKDEMVELYMEKGLNEDTSRRIVEILARDRKVFVDIMMVEELGIMPDEEYQIAWKHGLVNFTSFLAFGIVPLVCYIIYIAIYNLVGHTNTQTDVTFYLTIAVTAVTLCVMGIIKARFTGTPKLKSAFITLILGTLAGAVGFLTGWILQTHTGVKPG